MEHSKELFTGIKRNFFYIYITCTAEHLVLLSAATIRTRVGWAAIRAACVEIPFVYLLLVESSIGAHALKSFMADRV